MCLMINDVIRSSSTKLNVWRVFLSRHVYERYAQVIQDD